MSRDVSGGRRVGSKRGGSGRHLVRRALGVMGDAQPVLPPLLLSFLPPAAFFTTVSSAPCAAECAVKSGWEEGESTNESPVSSVSLFLNGPGCSTHQRQKRCAGPCFRGADAGDGRWKPTSTILFSAPAL
eukprot:3695843-Rhodomonas_salina.3